MNKEELIAKLKAIAKPYVQDHEALSQASENTDFIKDLKINSANLVDIILDIENEFDIVIDNESIERMLSMGAAMDIISLKINEKASR